MDFDGVTGILVGRGFQNLFENLEGLMLFRVRHGIEIGLQQWEDHVQRRCGENVIQLLMRVVKMFFDHSFCEVHTEILDFGCGADGLHSGAVGVLVDVWDSGIFGQIRIFVRESNGRESRNTV